MITEGETWKETINEMNKSLAEIDVGLADKKLILNANIMVYITFGNYCDSVPINLYVKIKDKLLDRVECCKYLGVLIDYNLKWNKHIEYLVNELSQSFVNYGIVAWGGAYSNNLNFIQRPQNKLLKIIDNYNFFKLGIIRCI